MDDFLGIEKLAAVNGYKILSTHKPELHIHAKSSQLFFDGITASASTIGLKVNPKKTQILSISNSGAEQVKTYMINENGRTYSQPKLTKTARFYVRLTTELRCIVH